jgi:hypothetical protein
LIYLADVAYDDCADMQKLSRSKLELLTECPRCFWLDLKKGVKRPAGFPFTINNAVDYLLKQEFDLYRKKQQPHPVMEAFHVDAIPFEHEKMDSWRHNFTGVQVQYKPADLLVYGAVDDVWVSPDGALHVVDYKATGANQHHIHDAYRRQMEIYEWLLAQNGFDVSPIGYFVFARVSKADGFAVPSEASREGGGARKRKVIPDGSMHGAVLPFDLFIEPLEGDSAWVPDLLAVARKTIDAEKAPESGAECEYCKYRGAAGEF